MAFPALLIGAVAWLYFGISDWSVLWPNLAFITVLLVLLTAYISIKNKQLTNILKQHFGLGDVLFFYAIIPLFNVRNLVLFIVTGMVFSLLLHLMVNRFSQKEVATVPLAGYLSIWLIGCFVANLCFTNNLFYTDLI